MQKPFKKPDDSLDFSRNIEETPIKDSLINIYKNYHEFFLLKHQ